MVDITEIENNLEELSKKKISDDQLKKDVNAIISSIPDPAKEQDLNAKVRLLVLRTRAYILLPVFSKEAERDCTAALKLQHNRPDLWLLLSECLERRHALREACDALDNALRVDARDVRALCRYSRLQRCLSTDAALSPADRRGALAASVARGKAAVAAGVADAEAWHVFALALLSDALRDGVALAGVRQAVRAVRQAVRLAPGDADVRFNAAALEGLVGHFGEAAGALLAAIEADRGSLRGARKMLEGNVGVLERVRSRMESARSVGKRRFAALLAKIPNGAEIESAVDNDATVRVAVGLVDVVSETNMEPLVALAAEKSGAFVLLLFYGLKRGVLKANDEIITLTFPNSTASRVHHVVPEIPLIETGAVDMTIMQVHVDTQTTMNGNKSKTKLDMVQRLQFQLCGGEGYGCAQCSAYLCNTTDVISRHFHGKSGKAFLTSRCFNYYFGLQEEKELMTGTHIVRDVFCSNCDNYVGWTYDFAHAEKERYKVDRFVLERTLIRCIDRNGAADAINATGVAAGSNLQNRQE